MEYLVHIEGVWPANGDPAELDRLTVARDATELHAAIASLPFYPWLSVEVHSLAAHPNDPHAEAGEPR